ncbi:hypothetical protein, partial [Campylobacter sp. MG1]|uniref:hypothetical protein n=1 Tax=Campylobacter sp. MG1 TaxID=2976332 RepID=UPI00226C6E43
VNKEYSKNFTNELDFTTYSNYYNKANAEFLNLNKDLGVNRQLSAEEKDKIIELTKPYAIKNKISENEAFIKLYFSAMYEIDKSSKIKFDKMENYIDNNEGIEYDVSNLTSLLEGNTYHIKMSQNDMIDGIQFLKDNSKGLTFIDWYGETYNTSLFTATNEQYKNSNWTPNQPQGLEEDFSIFFSLSLFNKASLSALNNSSKAIGNIAENIVENKLTKDINNSLLNRIDIGNNTLNANIANTVTKEIAEVGKKVEIPKAYKAPKGGGGVSYETTINGQTYTFGHGGRHAEDVGLNHVIVNEAIANHLSKTKIDWSKISTNNPYINYINLNGFKFKFIAKKLPNGKINIGTYYRIIDK